MKKWKKAFVIVFIGVSLLNSFFVITNEKNSYKTLKQGLDYISANTKPQDKIAYSDETGNSTWYLRKNGLRPEFENDFDYDSQYQYLKENNVSYLLWTNEFNRGSSFLDPKKDEEIAKRYVLLQTYEEQSIGALGAILGKLGLVNTEGYFVFKTKIYKVI